MYRGYREGARVEGSNVVHAFCFRARALQFLNRFRQVKVRWKDILAGKISVVLSFCISVNAEIWPQIRRYAFWRLKIWGNIVVHHLPGSVKMSKGIGNYREWIYKSVQPLSLAGEHKLITSIRMDTLIR